MNNHANIRRVPRVHEGGFTLLELLASIAIIAILVALTMAGFSRVKKSAASARCVSNLRQLAQAWVAYPQDHDGNCVQIYRKGSSGHWYYNADFTALLDTSSTKSWAGQNPVYLCPEDSVGQENISPTGHTRFLSYGGNLYLGAGDAGATTSPYYTVKMSRISNPSKLMVFLDANSFFTNDGSRLQIPLRHKNGSKGGFNIAYADGHVAWREGPLPSMTKEPDLWMPDGVVR